MMLRRDKTFRGRRPLGPEPTRPETASKLAAVELRVLILATLLASEFEITQGMTMMATVISIMVEAAKPWPRFCAWNM